MAEADWIDHAANVTQEAADRSILVIRKQDAKIDTSNPSGKCLSCGDTVGNERRFCDSECRDDWAKYQ
jgi:RNA polymerase-binding transcription factor DksA